MLLLQEAIRLVAHPQVLQHLPIQPLKLFHHPLHNPLSFLKTTSFQHHQPRFVPPILPCTQNYPSTRQAEIQYSLLISIGEYSTGSVTALAMQTRHHLIQFQPTAS